jgi:hypothetical protein
MSRGAEDAPLGLTVHSMPNPALVPDVAVQRTRVGRWRMIIVMLVCAAPVVASYFTFYVVRPEGRQNFGELIATQTLLPANAMATNLAGEPVNLQTLKDQWLLVSVGGGACDAACEKHLYLQRQMRESLGREKDRVEWVWLINDKAPVPDALRSAISTATVLRVAPQVLADWLKPAPGQAIQSHLYVVDPVGRWMMRFPASLDVASAAKAKRDLDRLLRASNSWDKPGR